MVSDEFCRHGAQPGDQEGRSSSMVRILAGIMVLRIRLSRLYRVTPYRGDYDAEAGRVPTRKMHFANYLA
jgi:hypothetical protein